MSLPNTSTNSFTPIFITLLILSRASLYLLKEYLVWKQSSKAFSISSSDKIVDPFPENILAHSIQWVQIINIKFEKMEYLSNNSLYRNTLCSFKSSSLLNRLEL